MELVRRMRVQLIELNCPMASNMWSDYSNEDLYRIIESFRKNWIQRTNAHNLSKCLQKAPIRFYIPSWSSFKVIAKKLWRAQYLKVFNPYLAKMMDSSLFAKVFTWKWMSRIRLESADVSWRASNRYTNCTS